MRPVDPSSWYLNPPVEEEGGVEEGTSVDVTTPSEVEEVKVADEKVRIQLYC